MLTPMSSTPSSQMTQTPSTTLSASVARYSESLTYTVFNVEMSEHEKLEMENVKCYLRKVWAEQIYFNERKKN